MAELSRVTARYDLPVQPDRIGELYQGRIGTAKERAREQERIDWLVSQARGDVLDLGCSQGIATVLCARRGLRAVGVDIDRMAIEHARRELAAKPESVRGLVRFELADARSLDHPDDTFDSVLVGNLLDRIDDPTTLLREIARVCRPGGRVALTVPFGFVPEPEHRTSFFAGSLIDTLAPHLTVTSIDMVDGSFRVVATGESMAPAARLALISDTQPRLEEWLAELQGDLWLVRLRRRKLARMLRDFDRKLTRRRWDARRAKWELARIRATRWWRLREALAGGRSTRGVAALPRELARALRREPPPPKPKRPKRLLKKIEEVSEATSKHAELTAGADRKLSVEIPEIEIPEGPVARPDLKVAVILDRFSATAFRYEWNQVQFGPEDWRETLERERPQLLFVESSWRGNDDRWRDLVAGRDRRAKAPLIDLIEWCRGHGVPTVFWNKEDPPNFNHFVSSAGHFDHVFTVDGETIPRYAEVLGREDVQVLQFGAQPRIHNPIALPGGRARDVAFAGTYFSQKHPARRAQMETILAPARQFGLEIFSRILQGEDPRFDWPPEYQPHIVGSLPYERMLAAYKAYKVFLNVNSVIDSPTMCARRIFELSACSTPVLSGYSRAIEETFGDLVPMARAVDETRELLAELLDDREGRERRAHYAMREAFSRHTYSQRVEQVLRTAGLPSVQRAPLVSYLATVDSPAAVELAVAAAAAQSHRPLELVLAAAPEAGPAKSLASQVREAGIEAVGVDAGAGDAGRRLDAALDAARGDLVAVLDPQASYEKHYLTDLVQAHDYANAPLVGKRSGAEHAFVDELDGGTLLVERALAERVRFAASGAADAEQDFVRRARTAGASVYAADRFSYTPPDPGAREPSAQATREPAAG